MSTPAASEINSHVELLHSDLPTDEPYFTEAYRITTDRLPDQHLTGDVRVFRSAAPDVSTLTEVTVSGMHPSNAPGETAAGAVTWSFENPAMKAKLTLHGEQHNTPEARITIITTVAEGVIALLAKF